jgi:hypothetical protein
MAAVITDRSAALGAAVIEYVSAILAEIESYDQRLRAAVTDYQQKGHRVISGGHLGGSWAVTDYVTGEIIASGQAGVDEYEKVCDELDPDDTWLHVENVEKHVEYRGDAVEAPAALPATLANYLLEWVDGDEMEARRLVAEAGHEPASASSDEPHA